MAGKLSEENNDKGFINSTMDIAYGRASELIRLIGLRRFRYSIAALAMSVLFNLAIIVFIPYRSIPYGTLLFIWPILCIFLLTRIYYSSIDKNIKYVTRLFIFALIPWTATLLLEYVILPFHGAIPLAGLIAGFGYPASGLILILGFIL